jgi:sulfur carrier protein
VFSPRNYNKARVPLTKKMTTEMQITLNGERRSFPDGTTLYGLVQALNLEPERVAIELNREIVRRDSWRETVVEGGAEIEVVMFVGGG